MNATLTTAGKRLDERRRMLLLGAAGASLAQLSGCGGGGSPSMMNQGINMGLVDPAAGATERSLPIVQQDAGVADGSGDDSLHWPSDVAVRRS